jgi:myosin-5
MYWDDKYNTQGISNEVGICWLELNTFLDSFCISEENKICQVVAAMREMVNKDTKDTQNHVSNSFLLDDDLR